jgi:hypothetical protein
MAGKTSSQQDQDYRDDYQPRRPVRRDYDRFIMPLPLSVTSDTCTTEDNTSVHSMDDDMSDITQDSKTQGSTILQSTVTTTSITVVRPAVAPTKNDYESAATAAAADEMILAAKYRKMLQMRVPKQAVRHKMKEEGIEQRIVTLVVGQ